MANHLTPDQIGDIMSKLERKYPLARCWFEPFPGRLLLRYTTGLSEYLTLPQAVELLAR